MRRPLRSPHHRAVFLTVLLKSLRRSLRQRTALDLAIGPAHLVVSPISNDELLASVARSPLLVLLPTL